MKKYLIALTFLICAIAIHVTANSTAESSNIYTVFSQVEAFAGDGGGDGNENESSADAVQCFCSQNWLWLGNNNCLANNHGRLCGQGDPGGNYDCRQNDSNCGSD